jgi:hypothetical protein
MLLELFVFALYFGWEFALGELGIEVEEKEGLGDSQTRNKENIKLETYFIPKPTPRTLLIAN